MNLVFSEQAWEDYLYWQKTDKKLAKRIHDWTGQPFVDTRAP